MLMSGYDKRILSNREKTQADLLKDNKMLSNALKRALGVELTETLEDGTTANIPIVDSLVAKKVAFMMENPDKIDLKELSSVLGEQKLEANLNIQSAQDLFGDIVNKKNETEW